MELSGSEEVKVDPPVETPADPQVTDPPSKEDPADVTKGDEGADPNPPIDPVAPAETLYELPDGRKVNAETLQKEWKENFLPDYTKKSQKLSAIERGELDITKPDKKEEPEWKDPEYVPKTYAEIIQIAKEEALREADEKAKAENERIQAIHNAVNAELEEIKKSDPKLDENVLFAHANKYHFSSLKTAYANMKDMKSAVVNTEQKVIKNLKTREADPVSSAATGGNADEGGYDPVAMSGFADARDFLAHIKGGKK